MKNRKLLLIVSLVLAMTMSLGGTLAYLQDSDSDVNTMTLGSVKIEQLEYERVPDGNDGYVKLEGEEGGYKLQPYTQDKPLLPAVGAVSGTAQNSWDETKVWFDQIGGEGNMDVLANVKNVQDKFVVVKNTGNSDAYVRTLIAYEAGSYDVEKWNSIVMTCKHNFWDANDIGIVPINGNNYVVIEYVYNRVLAGGAVSRNSLSQIYLMPEAKNEDLEALDGNKNGTYDILVLSQAVQANGFADAKTALDTGFGVANAENIAKWFKDDEVTGSLPVAVDDAAGLDDALNNGNNVLLANDIEAEADQTAPYRNKYAFKQDGQTIDGNNKTVDFECYGDDYGIMTSGGTIKNIVLKDVARAIVTMNAKENLVLENVTAVDGVLYPFNTAEHGTTEGMELIVNDSKFGGWFSFDGGFEKATFTDCAFVKGNYGYGWPYDCLVKPYINTVFDGCEFADKYYLDLSALEAGCKVTLKDCTVNGTEITSDLCGFNCDGTETFCIELPSGRNLTDCVIFE